MPLFDSFLQSHGRVARKILLYPTGRFLTGRFTIMTIIVFRPKLVFGSELL